MSKEKYFRYSHVKLNIYDGGKTGILFIVDKGMVPRSFMSSDAIQPSWTKSDLNSVRDEGIRIEREMDVPFMQENRDLAKLFENRE